MNESLDKIAKRVMSGEARGVGASILRGVLSGVEPLYSGVVSTRNAMFDKGRKTIHRLARPVICVGNVTTGGTGKTPVVCHLANQLRKAGRHPAILLRGYKSKNGLSDEADLLDRALNQSDQLKVIIHAQPDRVAGGEAVLKNHPETAVFLLDDGFQHRRLHRDFDLVLINATEPFGYGHVFPRGLLREPLGGLGRANAILLTHASEVSPETITSIESTIRQHNATAPIYKCDHVHAGLVGPVGELAIDALSKTRFFAFAGIGNPHSLDRALKEFGSNYVGSRWFADHHPYTDAEVHDLQQAAGDAPLLVTTEKDWAKIKHLAGAQKRLPAIVRLQLGVRFLGADEAKLLDQIYFSLSPCGRGPG